jgi:AcrR family transcriptional regulator
MSDRDYRMTTRADGVGRTRDRILGVARERFFSQPYDEVTLGEIASSAGVTQQTLLNHFSSKEGLALAVVESVKPEIEAIRGPVTAGDVRGAVRGLMREYEALGDATVRLAAVAERLPALAPGLALARRTHREWLERVFAPALPPDSRARRRTLAALYAASDVGTWKLLRRDLGHSRTDTAAIMRTLVEGALTNSDST